ncbi:hypothetical protein T08_8496, partial [Trichinella sp. T8]
MEDTKQIADDTKQNKTGFLGPKFCRSGIGILRKGEVIP